jgi:hypothetical protein
LAMRQCPRFVQGWKLLLPSQRLQYRRMGGGLGEYILDATFTRLRASQ